MKTKRIGSKIFANYRIAERNFFKPNGRSIHDWKLILHMRVLCQKEFHFQFSSTWSHDSFVDTETHNE